MDLETSAAIERMGERIDALEAALRAEFRDGFAANRRHSEMLFETLRDDIRILAEGFATISTKLDAR
jgi:hypothetical protein